MAVNFILAQTSPGAKVLVVATDISRFLVADAAEPHAQDWSFAEPSGGKLSGVWLAGRVLGWQRGDASMIGWLLQTKGLIELIFANILLDKQIITSQTFTAMLLMAVVSNMLSLPMVRNSRLLPMPAPPANAGTT